MRKAVLNLLSVIFIIIGAVTMVGSAGACDYNNIGIEQVIVQMLIAAAVAFIGVLLAVKGGEAK